MQTLLRDPAAGLMHSLIYFGFLILFAVTTVSEIDHQLPPSWKFLHGDVYRGYAAFGDAAGVAFLVGIVWAIVRRYVQRPYRIRIKTRPEDALILGMFLVLGVTGFVDRGVPHRARRPPDVRAVVVRRLPAVAAGRRAATRAGTRRCGSCTSSASGCSS